MSGLAGRRLALVFAHPDDETFATGATVARYAHEGVDVRLFCATDGNAGRSTVPVSSAEELGMLRRNELISAAHLLGIREVVTMGYPDKGLAALDPEQLIGDVVAFLRAAQPDVVITFGPEGAPTAHPDHRAISRATIIAFFLASLPTEYPDAGPAHRAARLYFATYPPPEPGAELQRVGLPATARIDARPWNERKREAFLLHVTQRMHERRFEEIALRDEEWFALASGVPQVDEMAGDLFEGIP